MPQMKEQKKSPEKELNEMEATKIPDSEFTTVVIRMLQNLRERMDNLSESLNKEIISIKKHIETVTKKQSEMKSTISEMKNASERINSRLDEAEDRIRDFEDRITEELPAYFLQDSLFVSAIHLCYFLFNFIPHQVFPKCFFFTQIFPDPICH